MLFLVSLIFPRSITEREGKAIEDYCFLASAYSSSES